MLRFRSVGISILVLGLFALAPIAVQAQDGSAQQTGSRTALLVIDVQDFYFPGGAMPLDHPEVASGNCGKLIEKFRADDRVIVHVAHNASKGAGFHADVTPREGEKVFVKDEVNVFNGTALLDYLRDNDIGRLVICGMQTHMCVEAAVRAAHDLGFECVLVRDACATRPLEFGGRTISAEDVHDSTLSTLDHTYATVVDTKAFLETN